MSFLELTDFRLAGFLTTRGVPFRGTDMNRKGEVLFLFDSEAVEELNKYPGSAEQVYDAACRTMHDFVKLRMANAKKGNG